MTEPEKLYHAIKSRAVNLKAAAEQLPGYPPDRRGRVLPLMREAAQELIKLLEELETRTKP